MPRLLHHISARYQPAHLGLASYGYFYLLARKFDAAKIAPSQIDYPGIGDTMVAA